MIIHPENNNNTFGVTAYENDNHYGDLDFIFRYVRDGLFPFLFTNGKDEFAEVLTNYSQAELRDYEFPDQNGDHPNNAKPFTRRGKTCLINVEQVFENHSRMSMNTLSTGYTFNNPLSSNYFVFKDNLLTLSYQPNAFKYNITLTITEPNRIKTSQLINYIYNRIHLNKKFLLAQPIALKHVIDYRLISLMKMLYTELDDVAFNDRLNEMSFGELYHEIDNTTGNMSDFINIRTNPVVNVTGLSTSEEGAEISLEVEVDLPSRFWLSSIYTEDELNTAIIKQFTVVKPDVLTEVERSKLVNFDLSFIINNRALFTGVTDADIEAMRNNELIPYISLANLNSDDKYVIGDNQEGFSTIENMIINLEEGVNDNVVNSIIDEAPTIQDINNVNWSKIKTIIINRLTVGSSDNSTSDNILNIGDDLFCSILNSTDINSSLVIKINNKLTQKYQVINNDNGTIDISFGVNINGSILSVSLYREVV